MAPFFDTCCLTSNILDGRYLPHVWIQFCICVLINFILIYVCIHRWESWSWTDKSGGATAEMAIGCVLHRKTPLLAAVSLSVVDNKTWHCGSVCNIIKSYVGLPMYVKTYAMIHNYMERCLFYSYAIEKTCFSRDKKSIYNIYIPIETFWVKKNSNVTTVST